MATTSSWHLIEAHKHGGTFLFISHILSRNQSVAWNLFDLFRVYISLSMGYLYPWSCTNSWAVDRLRTLQVTFTILQLLTTEVLHLSCATAWRSRCRWATLILHPKRCTRPTGATGWLNGMRKARSQAFSARPPAKQNSMISFQGSVAFLDSSANKSEWKKCPNLSCDRVAPKQVHETMKHVHVSELWVQLSSCSMGLVMPQHLVSWCIMNRLEFGWCFGSSSWVPLIARRSGFEWEPEIFPCRTLRNRLAH